MAGDDSLNSVGFLKTLTTAAGWILTVVSAFKFLTILWFA